MPIAKRRIDIAGQRFDRLTVIGFSHVDVARRAMWLCRCDCGSERLAAAALLRNGHTKSCGCMLRERLAQGSLRHGQSDTPAWAAWARMKSRCEQPTAQRFANYGGRGIGYCERWKSFENFLSDMGQPPAGFTLEREDVNGDYEPGNCAWIPADAQYSNTTRTLRVVLHGVEMPFRDLVAMSGINYETAYARLKTYGWPPERVFPNLKPEDLTKPPAPGRRPGAQPRRGSRPSASRRPGTS